MDEKITGKAHQILFFNTLAFMICFSAWMLNGTLVSFLVDNQVFEWSTVQIGWLLGLPVLTGSILRLPVGLLTDRFGGRPIFSLLMVISAIPMFLLSFADSYVAFLLCSFGFGLTGASFAVGVAYTSVWYPAKWQGTALGIFGIGTTGAALTTLIAPSVLQSLTNHGNNIENWHTLPTIYAALLLLMAVVFFIFTENKKPALSGKRFVQLLEPLNNMRVWRFGLYYFLVFGCFVAFSQWLVPYYLNVYYIPFVQAGMLASLFSFPAGIVRMLGGWLSDKFGPRKVLYSVFISSVLLGLFLVFPKMELFSPGKGIVAKADGMVTFASDSLIKISKKEYTLTPLMANVDLDDTKFLVLPQKTAWHIPIIQVGDQVKKNQLVAKGITRIYFQANMKILVFLVLLLGITWGLGMGAVYKFIPMYFPNAVGVVGGTVGVLGGLGGFFCPILFGYLLAITGLWTSSWIFIFVLSLACLVWMQISINKLNNQKLK
ncbi:MAG: MFS transporter [Bacteroidetes bacterium GWF2_41_31]|nr:MAG: MFS transporter [Bacteroidetes bacterium GWF2_41_31]